MKRSVIISLLFFSVQAFATGMVPETSVLLVDAMKGEASMNITNTDSKPALLYTNIVDLPESNKSVRLIVSQPVVRVEAGAVQRMRFLLQMEKPLMQEELKRVTFEGIPPKEKGKGEAGCYHSSGFTGDYSSRRAGGGYRPMEAPAVAKKG